MNLSSATIYIVLGVALLLAIAIQTIWIFLRYDSHRLRRLLGLGVPGEVGSGFMLGLFHWKASVSATDITQAMTAEYAQKDQWLITQENQRRFVVLVVVAWLLNLLGTFNLSWNLGLGTSLFSWWSLLVVVAYLVLRQSVRALADAPDELLDERLTTVRDSAYRSAYHLLGWIVPILVGISIAVFKVNDEALTFDHVAFGLFTFGFLFEGLPSTFIAWRGQVRGVD